MTRVQIDRKSLAGVFKVLKEVSDDVRKEVRIVISKTAADVKSRCTRKLARQTKMPSKIVGKSIQTSRTLPRNERLIRTVYFNPGYNIPLKFFNPEENDTGVKVDFGAGLGGVRQLPRAFIVKKYGGNVFRRKTKKRQSLFKLQGPTPRQAMKTLNIVEVGKQLAAQRLPIQVQRRLRFLTLKAQGKLKR